MKKLILILAEVAGVIALAANVEKPTTPSEPTVVMSVGASSASGNVGGCATERPKSAKARKYEKLQAQAAKKGVTVSELVAERDKKDAARYGVEESKWIVMTKAEKKAARQQAKAAKLGMTVEQMKAEANRKAAEKAGCSPEKWAAMSVKERIAFRKEAGKE